MNVTPVFDGTIAISISETRKSRDAAADIIHEGAHGLDDQKRGRSISSRNERKETEVNAYTAEAHFQKAENYATSFNDGWVPGLGFSQEKVKKQAESSILVACGQSTAGSCGSGEQP